MGLNTVGADSQHLDPGGYQLIVAVPKAAGFPGAPGSVILGIEIQDHLAPPQVFQRDSLSGGGGEGEVRGFITNIKHMSKDLSKDLNCGTEYHVPG
jgi:hypothetical protein